MSKAGIRRDKWQRASKRVVVFHSKKIMIYELIGEVFVVGAEGFVVVNM